MPSGNLSRKVTIYDIAKEAGVSVATVSRVLTGSAPVRENTRIRVQRVIDKYNFQPSAIARYLTWQQTMTVGVILPDITNPFFSTVFSQIQRHALDKGYTVSLWNSMNDRDMESRALLALLEEQVDGIVFMGGRANDNPPQQKHVDEVNDILTKIPAVMVNGFMEGVDCHCVCSNEAGGIVDLVAHLASLGHKNLGFIDGISGITSADIKRAAFHEALDEFQLQGHGCVVMGGFSVEGGVQGMEQILQRPEHPTAIVCVNDLVAIGAIKEAYRHGLEVPRDISVTGFDNIYLTGIYMPEITTVDQNYEALSKLAVDMLIGAINNEDTPRDVVVDTRLVVRDSCGPAA
jgi:LacI family transcriptional regulator/LacI family purine nucleotide synthesis repressor/LacI family repressor for deo operon, udp, cdd, tsx, nupC, and nupG